MNIENIKLIYNDLNEVLASQETRLSQSDRARLIEAKETLAVELSRTSDAVIDPEKQQRYFQLVLWIIEIIKSISDNFN